MFELMFTDRDSCYKIGSYYLPNDDSPEDYVSVRRWDRELNRMDRYRRINRLYVNRIYGINGELHGKFNKAFLDGNIEEYLHYCRFFEKKYFIETMEK